VREVPTYDYKCTKCGYEFAVEQSILDKPLVRCRKCRGKLEKMLPKSLNLIFKGSGFYITDYKKPDTKGRKSTPGTTGETSVKKAEDNGSTESSSSGSSPAKSTEKRSAEAKPGGGSTT
jgi:putative FmdB family regulatory protein